MKKNFIALASLLIVCILLTGNLQGAYIYAEESPEILKTFLGSEAQNPEDMLKRSEETGSINIPEEFQGHIWGFYTLPSDIGTEADDILKIALIVKINSIGQEDGLLKVNPLFDLGDGVFTEYGADFPIAEFQDYMGETVILVGAFTVPEECERIEARMWHSAGIDVELLEVVIAENGYNFEGYKGFSVVEERYDTVNYDSNAEENMFTEEDPSWKDPNASPEPENTDEPTEAPQTEISETQGAEQDQEPVENNTPTASAEKNVTESDNDGGTVLWIIIGVVLIAAAAVVVFVIWKKRKSK